MQNARADMKTNPLEVERLILDVANPRITKAESQRETLQRILDDQRNNLAVLAEDIILNGLNPMDRWLVLPADEELNYVVIEGNRRLAAIKILNNPWVLGDLQVPSGLKKKFEALSLRFDLAGVSPVDCFIVANREEAAKWIQQRHTGANEGKGIVNWSGVATARFRGNSAALQAFDLVMEEGGFSAAKREEIESKFPITTLERLLSTPDVRRLIGVQLSKGTLSTDLSTSDLVKVLRKIVTDLDDGVVNVNHLKKKEQQVDYVARLTDVLPDLSIRTGEFRPIMPSSITEKTDAANGAAEPIPQPKPKPQRLRSTLITSDCKLNVVIPKIQKIEKELRKMELAKYPNAISTLLRVFLELSADEYLKRNNVDLTFPVKGGGFKNKTLQTKMGECLATLELSGVPKKDLDGVRVGITSPNNPLNIDTLHGYIHNAHLGAIEADLTTSFDNARPFFEGIWK
jgi:hypothetical protein